MTDLIVIPDGKALDIFTAPKGLDPYIKEVRDEVSAFVADISTEAGRKQVASMAYKVAKSKTALDNIGKELVGRLKEQPKLVDAERKRMREALDDLRDEVRKPLNDWEAAEEARAAAHTENIAKLWELHDNREDKTAEQLKEMIALAEAFVIDDSLQEFKGKATIVKDKTLAALRADLEKQEALDAERAELERLRQEAADREQKEREDRIAKEAEERATKAAEEAARQEREAAEAAVKAAEEESKRQKEALEQAEKDAERERVEALEREKQAVIDAEERVKRESEEAERAAKWEQEKREKNKRHSAKINNQAAKGFVSNGYTEEQAKELVTLIAKGLIKNVTISY